MVIDEAMFKLLESKRNFDPQTLEIARRRILHNENARHLKAAYGVNLPRIYAIEKQIVTAAHALRVGLPPGWGEMTLVAPKAMLREFARQAAAARKQFLAPKRKAAGAARGKRR